MVLRCHFKTFRIWNGDQMRWFDAQPCEWKMPAIDIIVLIHANGKLCSRLDPSEPIAIMNALRFFWWRARTQLCAVNETPKTIDQYLHLCSCDQNAEINSIDATFQPNAQAESYDFFGLVSGFEFLLSYQLAFFYFCWLSVLTFAWFQLQYTWLLINDYISFWFKFCKQISMQYFCTTEVGVIKSPVSHKQLQPFCIFLWCRMRFTTVTFLCCSYFLSFQSI